MSISYYSLVQYCPDPAADERINIGLLVCGYDEQAGGQSVIMAPTQDWNRVREFGCKDTALLSEVLKDLSKMTAEEIQEFREESSGAVVLTEPKSSTLPPIVLAHDLRARLLK